MSVRPWTLVETVAVPGTGEEMRLLQRGDDFSIRLGTIELMNSRAHHSEEQLAALACAKIAGRPNPRCLIAGLGMGYTLRATLDLLGPQARVSVAELVPAVVAWNRGPLAGLSGNALTDPRVDLVEGDVADVIASARATYDAILLDVDDGPEDRPHGATDRLFKEPGLRAAYAALRTGGVFAVWSPGPNTHFAPRLRKVGFAAEEHRVRAASGGGSRHVIWIAMRTT
jgi:spermidine synthase